MLFKGALILLLITPLMGTPVIARSLERQVQDAQRMSDWDTLVQLLEVRQGQKIEHDFILARAHLSLGNRTDALEVLHSLAKARPYLLKNRRFLELSEIIAKQFLRQETADLYYEAVSLMGQQNHSEARERLERASKSEPGQGLVRLRLAQLALIEGKLDLLKKEIARLSEIYVTSDQRRLLEGRYLYLADQAKDGCKILRGLQSELFQAQATALWWMECLFEQSRSKELTAWTKKIMHEKPHWVWALVKAYEFEKKENEGRGEKPSALQLKIFKHLETQLKTPDLSQKKIKEEDRANQYFWSGYFTGEPSLPVTTKASPAPTAEKTES